MAKAKGEGSPLYLPGWDNEEHVRIVLDGMKLVASDLGLDGRLAPQ